jgi:hypothetical protein
MALGVGESTSDSFENVLGGAGEEEGRRGVTDVWIPQTQSKASPWAFQCWELAVFDEVLGWRTERSGGWMVSAWSRPPRRLVVADSFCSYTNQVFKRLMNLNLPPYTVQLMELKVAYR